MNALVMYEVLPVDKHVNVNICVLVGQEPALSMLVGGMAMGRAPLLLDEKFQAWGRMCEDTWNEFLVTLWCEAGGGWVSAVIFIRRKHHRKGVCLNIAEA